uniref:Si:cabz01007807.1 n=1 Tax=Cyprinus carpio carpio TaxID=630221 RepID=A0A9J8AQ26_CYPCA
MCFIFVFFLSQQKKSKPKFITHRRGSKVKSAEASAKVTPDYKDDLPSSSKHVDLVALGEKKAEDVDCKPKQLQKFKPPVPRRPSKDMSAVALKSMSGPPLMAAKSFSKDPFLEGDVDVGASVQVSHQMPDIDTHLDDEERNTEETDGQQKPKKKVRVKFVPHRGFVIGLSRVDKANHETKEETRHLKESDDSELKGACGFTPHPDLKDEDGFDDQKGTFGYKAHELKEETTLKTGAGRSHSPNNVQSSYSNGFMSPPSWDSKASDLETDLCKVSDLFTASDGYEKHPEMPDCRPKKSLKFKVPRIHRRHSKSTEDPEIKQIKDRDTSEMKKPPLLKVPALSHRDSKSFEDDEFPQKGADLFKAGDVELAEDAGWEEYTPDDKPQKPKETDTHRRGSKTKDMEEFPEEFLDPPGATSGDFGLSEAAKAEWMSAQMDMRRLRVQEEEQQQEEEDDEGDTDSLMEWWNTVVSWDEIPPNATISSKEEETISFKAEADKVHRALRVYLKLFMERAELLYQHVLILYGIADDLSNFHHRAKIANITGGTTTAVGGAAAIAGLALVPVTFGASIIISAIGLGVATAGGITAASASISDTINNMHDRKKIELIIMDYEAQLVEMQRCLRFIIEGLCRLRSHPLLRRNNYYTGDWEVRRALQTISLVNDPVDQAEEIISLTLAKLASLQKGIDKYFTKDSKEVKKGCKKEVTAEVRSLAKQLHEGLAELNSIREQLLDASGNI